MKYMSSKEASEKWKISDRRIRVLCNAGRIEGAIKIGRNLSIPADAANLMYLTPVYIDVKDQNELDLFLNGEAISFLSNEIKGLDDFELICFLVVK